VRHDLLEELRAENPVPEAMEPPPFAPLLARLEEAEPLLDGPERPKPRSAWRRARAVSPALVSATVAIAIAAGAVALLHAARKPVTTGVTPPLAAQGRVRVWIANGNNGQNVSNGGVAGRGHFKATGAISDTGAVVTYRTDTGALITLRYVTTSTNGTITYVVKITPYTGTGSSRWTITSATGRYKGLQGKGTESENPPEYTISILTGTIWR
jgi:hypothetical protein